MLEIVIGPPGCGKTTYCEKRCSEDSTLIFYDDFLTDNINSDVWKDIKEGKNVIINDPRLCNPRSFDVVIEKINGLTDKDNIMITLFQTTLEQCKRNIKKRMDSGDNRDTLKCLEYLFKVYNSETYEGYNVKNIDLSST